MKVLGKYFNLTCDISFAWLWHPCLFWIKEILQRNVHCGAWMGPGPYFIGNPGEIKDNRGSDKIPGRQSGSWGLQQCNVYSGGGCTVQYSTVSGARRAEQGLVRELWLAVSGIPYLIAQGEDREDSDDQRWDNDDHQWSGTSSKHQR